eukprot:jgi/Mesvir1/28120/Mv04699-RA.1
MISRHLQQYVDNNCVGGAQMDVLLEDGVDGAKRAVIRLSEMDDDKEDVNIRLRRHDDNTADCVFGSGGMEDESQVFHDAAEKVVEWMMGSRSSGWGKSPGRGGYRCREPVSEGAGGSDGDTAKMTRFKEQADAYKLRTLAKRVVAEVRTETAPPEVRNQMMTLHQVAELIVKNACAPDGATQPEEIPSAKALIKWMQENLFEGKGKERKCKLKTVTMADAKTLIKMLKEHDARRDKSPKIAKGSKKAAEAAAVEGNEYVQAERATHAAILYSISLDQHARRENMKIDSTWTAAVDEHQKGLSEALATYKGKALKGKGKGKEVEVADAPVSLLEKWEKSPVSQDDDDILDVNDEIAKGKRLRQELAVQPRDLDEMSKALVHRNRVWTRNLFVGPQKLLARDLHLSRGEQNAPFLPVRSPTTATTSW